MHDNTIYLLRQQFSYLMPPELVNDRFADYLFLNQLSSLCAIHFPADRSKAILRAVADVYQGNSCFARNAIQNEFIYPLLNRVDATIMTENSSVIPQPLWKACGDVSRETHKKLLL